MSVLIPRMRASTGGPGHRVAGVRRRPSRTHYTTHSGRAGHLIRVIGEIDAANDTQLVDQVRDTARCEWLVLDLSAVTFMGTAGIAALQTVHTYCTDADVRWALVASQSVLRVLAICGREDAFPTGESLTAALAKVQKHPEHQ